MDKKRDIDSKQPYRRKRMRLRPNYRLFSSQYLLRRVLNDIENCQADVKNITITANLEKLGIAEKYYFTKLPLYGKRTELITRIPEFWFKAITNHPSLQTLIKDVEKDCMRYMKSLIVEINEDGYEIRFYFNENPYFENELLVKRYRFGDLITSESTAIVWKEGVDLIPSQAVPSVSNSGRRSGSKRNFDHQTFFTWFTYDTESMTVDEIAEMIKDDLWPNPVRYYYNACEEDDVGTISDSDSSEFSDGNKEEI